MLLPKVNEHEMQRKQAMTRVTGIILEAMESCDTPLTDLEWLAVFQGIEKWILDKALRDDWKKEEEG